MMSRIILLFISLSLAFLSFVVEASRHESSPIEQVDEQVDVDESLSDVKCENNGRLRSFYNPETDQVVFPVNNYCYISTRFSDHWSADDAINDAEKRFVHVASKFEGKRVAHVERTEDGALTDEIYITAYVKNAKIVHRVVKRWVVNKPDENKLFWKIQVGFRAIIKRHPFEEQIIELFNRFKQYEIDNKRLNLLLSKSKKEQAKYQNEIFRLKRRVQKADNLRQRLRNEAEHLRKSNRELETQIRALQKRNAGKTEGLNREISDLKRQLYEANQKYIDQKDWYIVGPDLDPRKVNENKAKSYFERFCNSLNETVKRQCQKRRRIYFEDKRHLKEFIEYAKIEARTGNASPRLYNKLGVAIWMSQGILQEAQGYFKEALALNPDTLLKRNITYNLATILGHQSKFSEGRQYLDNFEKDHPDAFDSAGRVLRAALRSREAQASICKDLRLACQNAPDKQRFCQNWERAKEIGDCFTEMQMPSLKEDILERSFR